MTTKAIKRSVGTLILNLILGFILSLAVDIVFPSEVYARLQSTLNLSQESFASPDYNQTTSKNFRYFGASVKTPRTKKGEEPALFQTDVQGQFSPDAPALSYVNPKEMYFSFSGFAVGRKKEKWSEIDETWQLGLYQPLFRFNVLQPEAQGLTGLFYEADNGNQDQPLGFMLFASGVYIPDQGPGYEIKEGKFVKSHPYFAAPPARASINGVTTEINYTIEQPDLTSIIFNRSFGSKVYFGKEAEGFFAQAATAYKPSNQLALGVQGYASTKDTLETTVLPASYDHTLYSMDARYALKYAAFGVGYLHESPNSPNYTQEWTYYRYQNSDLVSPYIDFKMMGVRLRASYLKVTGGDAQGVGDMASAGSAFLPSRYPFQEAYLLDARYFLRMKKRRYIEVDNRVLRGVQGEFVLWNAGLNYQFETNWAAGASLQMISVSDSPKGQKSFYSPYQNNDLVSIGVSYVF